MDFLYIKGKKPSEMTEKDVLLEIAFQLKKMNEIALADCR